MSGDVRHTFADVANGTDVETVAVQVTMYEGGRGPAGVLSAESPLDLTAGVLSLDDSGYEAAGTTAAALVAHEADTTDAHALAGITGLTAALAGKADDADVTALDGRLDVLEAVTPVLTINGDPPDVDGNVDIAAGGGAVDSVNGQTGVVVLDADDIADGTTNHAFTATDDTKLAGVASGATANATDAQLRDRSTHTGTQLLATISDAGTAAAADTGDFEAAGAVAAHSADTTSVHGIADTADLIVEGDARLTDPRTPAAHAASHQDGGTDELALDGSQITTGTVADARIASTIARDSEVAATYAPLASPALTGNPTAPTQSAGNDSTRLATTAFVTAAVAAGGGGGGSGWTRKGTWASGTAYAAGDLVRRAGGLYLAQQASTGADPRDSQTLTSETTGTMAGTSWGAENATPFTVSRDMVVTAIRIKQGGASAMTVGKRVGISFDVGSGATAASPNTCAWISQGAVSSAASGGAFHTVQLDSPAYLKAGVQYFMVCEEKFVDYYTAGESLSGGLSGVGDLQYNSGSGGVFQNTASANNSIRFGLYEPDDTDANWRFV